MPPFFDVRRAWEVTRSGLLGVLKYVVPSVLSIGVAFYLATHLRPSLNVKIATGKVMTADVEGKPNEFLSVLVDTSATPKKLLVAHSITFKSSKDFKRETGPINLVKLIVENDGYATANHVRLGIGFPDNADNFELLHSPNAVILTDKSVPASTGTPAHRFIEIEKIAPHEAVILTAVSHCNCGARATTKLQSHNGQPLMSINKKDDLTYTPVLFMNSAEGIFEAGSLISFKEAVAWEDIISWNSAYWAAGLKMSPKANPVIKPASFSSLRIGNEDIAMAEK